MADCANDNDSAFGTCISSLFIMKHSCLENLSGNVYGNNEICDLSEVKCLPLDGKVYFNPSRQIVAAAADGVLNACKGLHDSSEEDADNFKKKRCVDGYDSSESSDSGVLTGSTCSESCSNSGNSDITDPSSPYSGGSCCRSEKNSPDCGNDSCSKILNGSNDDEDELLLVARDAHEVVVNELENSVSAPVSRQHIRFPRDRKSSSHQRICRWADCVDHVPSSTKLMEHLQTKHVKPQTSSGTFICLWDGCKVFGRASCSRTFLERHVLSHGGNRPFQCIVDNCGQRFRSQLMLERHVNQHFETPKETSDGVVDTTPKLIRRNGQKLRYRRQQYSVRNRADAFDAGVMAQLQYSLVRMAQRSKTVSLYIMDSKEFLNVTFQPKVIGSRREEDGETKYLIRWYPYNSLEDEWLCKSEIEHTKSLPVWDLPASVQHTFWNTIFPKQSPAIRQPRKYKPESSNT